VIRLDPEVCRRGDTRMLDRLAWGVWAIVLHLGMGDAPSNGVDPQVLEQPMALRRRRAGSETPRP
jgi:hypothetical protein